MNICRNNVFNRIPQGFNISCRDQSQQIVMDRFQVTCMQADFHFKMSQGEEKPTPKNNSALKHDA